MRQVHIFKLALPSVSRTNEVSENPDWSCQNGDEFLMFMFLPVSFWFDRKKIWSPLIFIKLQLLTLLIPYRLDPIDNQYIDFDSTLPLEFESFWRNKIETK